MGRPGRETRCPLAPPACFERPPHPNPLPRGEGFNGARRCQNWRWGIEGNFREEKILFGIHEYQVRAPASVRSLPAMAAAAYALLLPAGEALHRNQLPRASPLVPKWRKGKDTPLSTQNLLARLRHEIWRNGIARRNFSDFSNYHPPKKRASKFHLDVRKAIIAVRK